MPESKARTAQVQTSQGWKDTCVAHLAPGDRFRMVKPDGTLVSGQGGATEFTAGLQVLHLQPVAEVLKARVRARFAQYFAPAAVPAVA